MFQGCYALSSSELVQPSNGGLESYSGGDRKEAGSSFRRNGFVSTYQLGMKILMNTL
jgi:hypothetical protein